MDGRFVKWLEVDKIVVSPAQERWNDGGACLSSISIEQVQCFIVSGFAVNILLEYR